MLSSEVRCLEDENVRLRDVIEKMKVTQKEAEKKPKACEFCGFFLQHYVKTGNSYVPTYCGHCVHGRIKGRKPDDSCQYFELGNYDIKKYI